MPRGFSDTKGPAISRQAAVMVAPRAQWRRPGKEPAVQLGEAKNSQENGSELDSKG